MIRIEGDGMSDILGLKNEDWSNDVDCNVMKQ